MRAGGEALTWYRNTFLESIWQNTNIIVNLKWFYFMKIKIGRLRETRFTYLANFLLASFLILFSKVVIFTKFNVQSDKSISTLRNENCLAKFWTRCTLHSASDQMKRVCKCFFNVKMIPPLSLSFFLSLSHQGPERY